jgi:HK97 family phage major capsid protein
MSMEQLNQTVNELGFAFQEFQNLNNQRWQSIEQDKAFDPLDQIKIDQIGLRMNQLEKTLQEFKNKNQTFESILPESMEIKGRPFLRGQSNSPEDRKLFARYLRNGEVGFEQKSLSGDRPELGGHFIPANIVSDIYKDDSTSFRSLAKVTSTFGNALDVLTDRNNNPSVRWIGNGETVETETPEIHKIHIALHRLYAYASITKDLLEDAQQFDVVDWLIQKIRKSMLDAENKAFILGAENQSAPKGILACDVHGTDRWGSLQYFGTGVDGGFNEEDPAKVLFDALYSLREMHRKNATWLMSSSTLSHIRQFKDTGTGRYLWEPSLNADQPSLLLGRPVVTFEEVPSLILGTPSKSILIGDFASGYQIATKNDLLIERNPFHKVDSVSYYVKNRIGGDVINYGAIKVVNFSK